MESARVFTVGDANFFLGVVALVNSLRMTGSQLPVTVLDLGFTAEQRRVLEGACDLHQTGRTAAPNLAKLRAVTESDADVAVLVDSDVLVCRPLDDIVALAEAGNVYAFVDRPAPDRWFAEWEQLFALDAPPRHQPAANAGFVAFSTRRHARLLEGWSDSVERLGPLMLAAGRYGYPHPLWLSDQDALNGQLMSTVPADRITWGPPQGMVLGAGPMREARLVDRTSLACVWEGEPVTVLHSIGRPKPWQFALWNKFEVNAYTRGLRRAFNDPAATIRIPSDELVPWLRPGPVGTASGAVFHALYAPLRWTRPVRRRIGLSPLRGPWRRAARQRP